MNNAEVKHNFYRGEIFYVFRGTSLGSEQQAGRPAVIVSNNTGNTYSDIVEVVYLTTQPKNDLPTHVTIRSANKTSTALCEQISTVDISRIGDYINTCTAQEMEAIDRALMISLGLDEVKSDQTPKIVEKEVVKEVPVEVVKEVPVEIVKEVPVDNPEIREQLIAEKARADQLQKMYDNLLKSILKSKKE